MLPDLVATEQEGMPAPRTGPAFLVWSQTALARADEVIQ